MNAPIKVIHLNKTILHLEPSTILKKLADIGDNELTAAYLSQCEDKRTKMREQRLQITNLIQQNTKLKKKIKNLEKQLIDRKNP